jgi:hypothetical protein
VSADEWRELQQRRFPELPFDCGNSNDPGIVDSPDFRDWTGKKTTADQRRIERYVDRYDLGDKRLLHIGIGNSDLAKRLHRRAREIVGTTVDQREIDLARSLSLPNYTVVEDNKYSAHHEAVTGRFHFIIDNNPTSACCCFTHLAQLFGFFDAKLAGGGQIVTDREGLGWTVGGVNPRWSFDLEDLAAVAALAGFSARRANRNTYILFREAPEAPHLASLLRHTLRRSGALAAALPAAASRAFGRVRRLLAAAVRGAQD